MENLPPHLVHRQKRPSYPTKLQAAADAELLKQHLPPQWLSHRELAAVAGALLAANVAGCGGGRTAPLVAPVFEHGEGKFANPQALITPLAGTPAWPAYVTEEAFLSHDEALGIIAEELAQAGLSMTNRDVRLDRVVIRGHDVRKAYDWVHNC